MRVVIGAVMVLVTAASLAACGTVTAPRAAGPDPHPSVTAPIRGVPGPPAGSRAEATALARQLLSRLRLPAGARRLPATPLPASMRDAFAPTAGPTDLDLHQVFAVAQPLDALALLLSARVPTGLSLASTGQGYRPGGGTTREVGYTPRSLAAGIYWAQLTLTMVPDGPGESLLRADAQVIWYPSRTAAEYIDPARYHVLTVAVTLFGRGVRTIHRVVTSQAVINRLAAALNGAQADPIETASCPMIFATYRLALAVARHSSPLVVISATRWPCGGAGITAGGRAQPPLVDKGAVSAVVDQALGINPQP